jgi:hypothetical protein
MAVSANRLVGEIKAISRGRGVQAPRIDRRVGPALRAVCGIKDSDGAEVSREKIGEWVAGLTRALPDDLKLAVVTALGLNPEAQQAFLAHRFEWLSVRLRRDARTIRRRVDDGLMRLAEAALRQVERTREDWYVARVQVELRLDETPPVRVERWTVVALRDGVDEIALPGAADIAVVQGAVASGRGLRFVEPLSAGETREFRVHAPLLTPAIYALGCERFDLVVADNSSHDVPSPRTPDSRGPIAATA